MGCRRTTSYPRWISTSARHKAFNGIGHVERSERDIVEQLHVDFYWFMMERVFLHGRALRVV